MDSDFYRRPSSTTSVRPSISSPESQHASRQPDMSSFKEKEYLFNIKELQSLLNESESNMDRLNETISILKKELENNERAEMRKDMNIEYLKNIVLAYFDAFDKEPLITVLARVLQLSEEEVDKLRKSSVGNTLPVASGWYF